MSLTLARLRRGFDSGRRSAMLKNCRGRVPADEILRRLERMAERLQQNSVSVLAIAADNSPDWVIADLAAQRAGIPVVPLPPFFSAEQVAHVLADSGADAIAADEAGSAALKSLPTEFAGDLAPELALLRLPASGRARLLPQETAKISYTSGTTGTPKGVCLTQSLVDSVAIGLHAATMDMQLSRHLCLLPLATLLENVAGVYAPLHAGAEIILPSLAETGLEGASGVNIGRLLQCLHRYSPESVILLPQLLLGLVGAVEHGARLPASLRLVAVGGGTVGMPLLERADLAGIPVFEGYGLTECGSVVAFNTPRARRIGSVGRPLPQCRIRIGEDSEVFVSGAVMSGYLGEPITDATEIATGDIGHLDEDGFLFIDGRKKNVIVSSFGRNVSPEWVEAGLTSGRAIAQAAVFGDGRPFNVAVVVPRAGTDTSDIELDIAEVNRRLPDYARVSRWVFAPDAFTSSNGMATANGRLRRPRIESRYATEIDACYRSAIERLA